jgi:hypothetical protein
MNNFIEKSSFYLALFDETFVIESRLASTLDTDLTCCLPGCCCCYDKNGLIYIPKRKLDPLNLQYAGVNISV